MKQLLQLTIDGIICRSVIGCYAEERGQPQEIQVSLKLDLNRIVADDNLDATLDYHQISLNLQQKIANTNFKLLESLAQFVAKLILAEFTIVDSVEVTVSKPSINDTFARRVSCSLVLRRTYHIGLALGSNLNNPPQQLINAIELLHPLIDNLKVSAFYTTKPYGFEQQGNFYNACISGDVAIAPLELLAAIKKIEKLIGKVEQFSNGPRLIDIDIIFYADIIYQEYFLQIPHPQCHQRDFVLRPLADIEPDWRHPKFGLKALELLAELPSQQLTILEQLSGANYAHIS